MRRRDAHLSRMTSPLDREIQAHLRKGREPESWKRPGGTRRDNQQGPSQPNLGQGGKPPATTGMNRGNDQSSR